MTYGKTQKAIFCERYNDEKGGLGREKAMQTKFQQFSKSAQVTPTTDQLENLQIKENPSPKINMEALVSVKFYLF